MFLKPYNSKLFKTKIKSGLKRINPINQQSETLKNKKNHIKMKKEITLKAGVEPAAFGSTPPIFSESNALATAPLEQLLSSSAISPISPNIILDLI
jgi:hypothetical protein